MAALKRSEGGSGGRVGHSNMSHHNHTAEVKQMARKVRRGDDSRLADEGWWEAADEQVKP